MDSHTLSYKVTVKLFCLSVLYVAQSSAHGLDAISSIYHVNTLFNNLFIYLFTLFLCIYWKLANLLIIMYLFIVYNLKNEHPLTL